MLMKKTLLIALFALLGLALAVAQEDDYLPIVREGVKWVNEKVIVNNGDTTHYYYKYEFSGYDNDPYYMNLNEDINNACYYYTGHHLDVEKDSLIAGLRDRGSVTCFRNHAYKKNLREGRMMMQFDMFTDGGTVLLFRFGENGCDDYYIWLNEFWEYNSGIKAFLTRDNFKMVDPITIEGTECERYAYIGEDGDTLAYVVEGIGFDSRDMGDLLTPFTRRPDPTADYQEWCGLCHVVKDGKVIYKGMRYSPNNMTGIDEVVEDKVSRPQDPRYYDLMGRSLGTDVPTTPGIYIHQGKKIVVR